MRREHLDKMQCEHGHAVSKGDPLHLYQRCHPGEGLDVVYSEGDLYIACHKCKELTALVAVAK